MPHPPFVKFVALCFLVGIVACGCRTTTPAPEPTRIVPYTDSEARQSPFINASGGGPTALPELESVRFQKGLRVGMTMAQLDSLAGRPGTQRLMPDDRAEWTIAWTNEGTGFRVQLREGRVVAWMQASALAVRD